MRSLFLSNNGRYPIDGASYSILELPIRFWWRVRKIEAHQPDIYKPREFKVSDLLDHHHTKAIRLDETLLESKEKARSSDEIRNLLQKIENPDNPKSEECLRIGNHPPNIIDDEEIEYSSSGSSRSVISDFSESHQSSQDTSSYSEDTNENSPVIFDNPITF